MWTERRENLRAYVQKIVRQPVDDAALERWWIFDAGGLEANFSTKGGVDKRRAHDFRVRMQLCEEDERILLHHPDMREPDLDY